MDGAARPVLPPRVSVIIATYNWSSVLRHAIASVLAQSYADFELLVVGDACTDDSAEVVASFGDPRIVWHNLEENFGSQVGPNNTGLALARGAYVAYLGHDDLWLPHHLEVLVNRLDAPEPVDLAYTIATMILPDGGRWVSGLTSNDGLGPTDYVVPSSLMHRREVLHRIGPWANHRLTTLPPDAEWQFRAKTAGLRFGGVDRLTVIKFPSALRIGSYLKRSDEEQRAWWHRLQHEPDLAERELVTLLRKASAGELACLGVGDERFAPPGYSMRRNRWLRGLEPGPPPRPSEPLPDGLDARDVRLGIATVPSTVAGGARFLIEVDVSNASDQLLSSEPPHPIHLSYHWLGADGSIAVHDGRRSVLDEPVQAGGQLRLTAEVISPEQPGTYRLRVALVQEGVRWLDQPAEALPEVTVEVLSSGSS